jgi:hypothetical protein
MGYEYMNGGIFKGGFSKYTKMVIHDWMMTGGIPILGNLHNIRYGWDMNVIKWDTVDGRNPAPVGRWFIHPIITP